MLQIMEVLGCGTRQGAVPSRAHHGVPDPRLTVGVARLWRRGSRHRPPVALPWAHSLSGASSPQRGGRAAGSIGRKINSRLSGRHRLCPSSLALLP